MSPDVQPVESDHLSLEEELAFLEELEREGLELNGTGGKPLQPDDPSCYQRFLSLVREGTIQPTHIEDIPCMGRSTLEKLEEKGITTLKAVAACSAEQLHETAKLGTATANHLLQIAHTVLSLNETSLGNRKPTLPRLTTGCPPLDALLGGGVEVGALTEVAGPPGSGKTQLLHQLCVMALLPNEQGGLAEPGGLLPMVLYLDTEGTFQPERIAELATHHTLDPQQVLDQVWRVQVFTPDHLTDLLAKVWGRTRNKRVALILVDSIQFHAQVDEGQANQQSLRANLHQLGQLARLLPCVVVLTNHCQSRGKVMVGPRVVPRDTVQVGHVVQTRLWIEEETNSTDRVITLTQSADQPQDKIRIRLTEGGFQPAPNPGHNRPHPLRQGPSVEKILRMTLKCVERNEVAVKSLGDIPGLPSELVQVLEEQELGSFPALAISPVTRLVHILTECPTVGLGNSRGKQVAKLLCQLARAQLKVVWKRGWVILEEHSQMPSLTTGVRGLDQLLGGGLRQGSFVEVVGEGKRGMTALLHQLCVTPQLPKEKGGFLEPDKSRPTILVLDLERAFNPDLVERIADRFDLDPEIILKQVRIIYVQSISYLTTVFRRMWQKTVRLVLVATTSTQLTRSQVHQLAQLTRVTPCSVVVTTLVKNGLNQREGSNTHPIGSGIFDHVATTRLLMQQSNHKKLTVRLSQSPNRPKQEVTLRLTNEGLRDRQEEG